MREPIEFEQIAPLLASPEDTLILFHRSPDADAVGSAFALRILLEELGSRAYCVCADEVPARLRFLMHGMQESVLPESIPDDFEASRIVSVDTASPALLDRLYEMYEGQIDLMIDHHASGEPYADFCYVRTDAAAAGEIIFDLARELASEGLIRITNALCVDLYAAISGDTGCFRFSNVTPKTHLRASELIKSGIDSARINHLLYNCKSPEQIRAEAAGASNLHLFLEGRVAVVTFPYALKVALGLLDEHLETLVDIARSLMGVEVAICIRQPSHEGKFRVSMRSASEYNVGTLCRKFGGGGHDKAAGCAVTAPDIESAMKTVVDAIHFENN